MFLDYPITRGTSSPSSNKMHKNLALTVHVPMKASGIGKATKVEKDEEIEPGLMVHACNSGG